MTSSHISTTPRRASVNRASCSSQSLLKAVLVCWVLSGAAFSWAQDRSRAQQKSKPAECWVAEFREMALTTHVVGERERKALDWLSRHAKQCSDEQLVVLATNRPSWLGNADTARVAGAIDRELERRYVAGKGKVESLFDSPQAKQGDTQTTTTPAAPAPVVPATQPATTPAAVVVQQPPPQPAAN